jgi:hypothetical protein
VTGVEGELEGGAGAGSLEAGRETAILFRDVLERAFGDGATVSLIGGSEQGNAELTLALTSARGDAFALGFDKRGAAALLTRLLREDPAQRDALRRGPEGVADALAALIVREAGRVLGLELRRENELPRSPHATRHRYVVGNPPDGFEVSLWLALSETPGLAEARLRLPLIVAISAAPRAELEQISAGDLWLPEAGWLGDPRALLTPREGPVRGLLGTPDGEQGRWTRIDRTSALVWGPLITLAALCWGADSSASSDMACVQVELGHAELTLQEVLAGAPRRIRVVRSGTLLLRVDGASWGEGQLEQTEQGVGVRVTRAHPRPWQVA